MGMEEDEKQEIIQQFKDFLDGEFVPEPAETTVDLKRLFSELAGLKTEVRRESRQLKTALDEFRTVFQSLDSHQQELYGSFERQLLEKEDNPALSEPILNGLIELYDKVCASLEQRPPRLSLLQRWIGNGRQVHKWAEGFREGQEILKKRILSMLTIYGVSGIEAVGKGFDPQLMKAEGRQYVSDLPEGVVIAEYRKGFRCDERLIRYAEVIVNKRQENI